MMRTAGILILTALVLGPTQAKAEQSFACDESVAGGSRVVAQLFSEVRFGHFNTFQEWTREGSSAWEYLTAARNNVRMDRPIGGFLERIKDFGANYRLSLCISEPNVQYLEAIFVARRRVGPDRFSYTLYNIGIFVVANEANDRWQLHSFNGNGEQVLTEEAARELGFFAS